MPPAHLPSLMGLSWGIKTIPKLIGTWQGKARGEQDLATKGQILCHLPINLFSLYLFRKQYIESIHSFRILFYIHWINSLFSVYYQQFRINCRSFGRAKWITNQHVTNQHVFLLVLMICYCYFTNKEKWLCSACALLSCDPIQELALFIVLGLPQTAHLWIKQIQEPLCAGTQIKPAYVAPSAKKVLVG